MKKKYIAPLMEEAAREETAMIAESLINAKNELGDNTDYVKEDKNDWDIEW